MLRDVDKVVAHRDLVAVQSTTFIAKHKKGVSSEGLLLDWTRLGQDLNSTDRDVLVSAILPNVRHRWKESHVHLSCSSLRPESRNLVFLTRWFN